MSTSIRSLAQEAQLLRFLVKQRKNAASIAESASGSTPTTARQTSPFLPTKVPGSLKWRAPLIGRRVWKKLFIASNFGKDIVLPAGPKGKEETLLKREQARLKSINEHARLIELAHTHWPPVASADTSPDTSAWNKMSYLTDRGPYKGRNLGLDASKAFKGHKWQAEVKARKAEVERRLSKMDLQIAQVKKAKHEAKLKRKASMPF